MVTTSTQEFPARSGITIRPVANRHGGVAYGTSYVVTVPARMRGRTFRQHFKLLPNARAWATTTLEG